MRWCRSRRAWPRHRASAAIRIRNKDAALHAARLAVGGEVRLPESPYAHVFVARGTVELEGAGRLAEGDAARVTAAAGQRVEAVAGLGRGPGVADARRRPPLTGGSLDRRLRPARPALTRATASPSRKKPPRGPPGGRVAAHRMLSTP